MANRGYLILTFGCQMNVHESEKIAGVLEKLGYRAVNTATEADVVVFNTCAIRESAEQKIFGNIGELKNIKAAKPDMIIAVCGCMSQQKSYAEEICKRYPYVDIIFGTHNLVRFEEFMKRKLQGEKRVLEIVEDESLSLRDLPLERSSGVNAWVNIMYGCNNFCSYCIVPYVRGREISRTPESIAKEVKCLLDAGYRQITLLGQNVNSYLGEDAKGNKVDFASLLERLDKIEGKFRLRFMTSHPKDLSDSVIEVIAKSKHICHGIHLPVQSGSSRILKLMNRKYSAEQYLTLVEKIRKNIPDAELTTDIIVGFPTETEEDFKATLDLIKKVRYTQIFAFMYSKRKGTVAEKMDMQVEASVKKQRLLELNRVKDEILNELARGMLDREFEVLIEGVNKGHLSGSLDSGKTICLEGDPSLVGEFVLAKVTKVKGSVIFGEIVSVFQTEPKVKKQFVFPQKVSILPKSEKNLSSLRAAKQRLKEIGDRRAKSKNK